MPKKTNKKKEVIMWRSKLKIIISGGGTGGHVFPAIAIANALKKKVYNVRILFVGAQGKMEMQKVPEAGYSIIGLNIIGFQRRFTFKNFLVPFRLLQSLWKARIIIKRFKPHVVIGVGGYASGPVLQVATKRKIPTVIQEQNSYPGVTNKILSKKATKICVAYDGMDKYFPKEKIFLTGNPVRQDITNINADTRIKGIVFFQLKEDKKTVLIIGGSLGARTINQATAAMLPALIENNIQVIWQTGKAYYQESLAIANQLRSPLIHVFEFIREMDLAYAAADIIISRAGALAVSEICIVKKPAILIPSPNVAEDHQTRNAIALVNRQAAILIKDSEAKVKLQSTLLDLINDATKQHKIIEQLASLYINNSADIIADVILSLIKIEKNGIVSV